MKIDLNSFIPSSFAHHQQFRPCHKVQPVTLWKVSDQSFKRCIYCKHSTAAHNASSSRVYP